MKICILSEYFYPDTSGGTGTVLSKLVRQLKDAHGELEIDVITSRNLFRGAQGALPARENWDGIRIVRLPAPTPRKRSIKRRLAANMVFTARTLGRLLLTARRYDLVVVVTAPPTLPLAARWLSKLRGVPYLYLVYDLYLDMAVAMNMVPADGRAIRAFRRIQRDWFHGAARAIVLGRCMRDHVAATYGVPAERMNVLPIPSNLDLIVPQDKTATKFRRDNGIEGFLVLYAGNFAQYQDFDTLLDAAKLLKDRADISFAFVGDGAKRGEIAARIQSENLTNVRLLPFVPESELCDMLGAADVSLVTLERGIEGLAVPSKFYNILASGRATVACMPKISEIARVIAEGDCGVQIDQENPRALAEVLTKLADEPQTLERMGRNARRLCEERYSFAHIADQLARIFGEIVDANRNQKSQPNLHPKAPQSKPSGAATGGEERLARTGRS